MPDPLPYRPRIHGLGALLLGLLMGVGLGDRPAQAAGTTKPAAKFTAFSSAWTGKSYEKVAGCLGTKGTATFQLLEYPLSGRARSMKPAQARQTLKVYFKKLSGVALRDVTPKRSPANVRLFDYTYTWAGKNARTTRLHVRLKQDKKRQWVLASVTESPKPRA